ncbi:copper amine oxidase N-terminal domain-containing protein [bacterium]|nr:copper amine oxidase N-terminal domain-containing protein [bacterium]
MTQRRLAVGIISVLFCICLAIPAIPDSRAAFPVCDTAMVPMRAVFEGLGATVTYAGGRISAVRGTDTICLAVGSKEAWVNGRAVAQPTPPVLHDTITYVPLRFVAESLGAGVRYDGPNRRIVISDADRSLEFRLVDGHWQLVEPEGASASAAQGISVVGTTVPAKVREQVVVAFRRWVSGRQSERSRMVHTGTPVVSCRVGSPSFTMEGNDVVASFHFDERGRQGCWVSREWTRKGDASLRFRLQDGRWKVVEESLPPANPVRERDG